MKLTTLLLVVTLFQLHANETLSQNKKVSIDMHGATIENVLNEIEQITDYKFLYEKNTFQTDKTVKVSVKNEKLSNVLNILFRDSNVSIIFLEKQIHIKKKDESDLPNENMKPVKEAAKVQQLKVSGIVTDEDGNPLPGASVLEKGTTNGTESDFDGNFSLNVTNANTTLVVSFVGMISQEITIDNNGSITVVLENENNSLDEVVVTALGIKRQKKALGYATQTMKGASIVKASTPDVISSLAGQIAGVEISIPDGVEGSSTRIIIRGNNSISGDNQPLIIIDGVPQSNDFIERSGFGGFTDWGTAMNNINSYDIESMEVLKGPAAAALYGARGANGVVLITSKKGKKQSGLGINYTTQIRFTEATRFREMQNTFGQGGPVLSNDGGDPQLPKNADGEFVLPGVWDTTAAQHGGQGLGGRATWDDFSWYASGVSWGPRMEGQQVRWWDGELRSFDPQPNNVDAYYKTGVNKEHNLSFSTAGEMGSVRVSLTSLDHESVVPNSVYDQTTFNLGTVLNISEKITAEVNMTFYDYERLNSPQIGDGGDSYGKGLLYYYPRSFKVLDKDMFENEDGTKNPMAGFTGVYWGEPKDLWWKTYHHNTTLNRKKLIGSAKLNYDVTDWFSLTGRIGIENTNEEITYEQDPTDAFGLLGSNYRHNLLNKYVVNMDFLASVYKDDLLPDFNARFSFGGNSWSQSNYGMQGDRRSQPVAYPDQFSFANISDTRQLGLTESFYDKKINSLYGFLNLSYKDYLFLEVTGRNDWSSTLPVETNSYFYPSANVSFVATEAFDLDSLDWLSFAKLRVAFASTAIDTSPYRTASVFGTGSFAGNLTVSLPDEVPPVGLKPQISDSYEIGTTLGFMDNRLNLDLTYYYSNSYNQILSSPIPNSSGSGKYVFNTGELENYGFEVQLNANVINKSDLSWDILLNYSNNKNYVVALDDTAEFLELANQWGVYGPSVKVKPGEQYGAIYGYDYERNTNGEKLVSDDGHHYLTTSEKVILGNATPDFIFGLNNTLRYKNFSLGVNIDGKVGGDVFAGSYAAGMYLGHSPNTVKERNGGGLPYTASDGVTYNTGVILEGVHADGTTNTTVVNPIWKYMGNFGSAWGDRTALVNGVMQKEYFLHTETVLDNSWVKLRQVSLSYSLPQELLEKTNIFQRLSLSVVGRDLLYLYQNMPDNINPEGLVNVGNGQGVEWGSMPGFSSFTVGIQASF